MMIISIKKLGFVFVLFFLMVCLPLLLFPIDIERFECYNTDNGLSQNEVSSILCDSKGFLWIGTMNGLNRFDGYNFKIFQNSATGPEILTNTRVVNIWEDQQNFLWFKTYDGYYHYLNPKKETFATLPKYLINLEEKYSKMNCFFQYSAKELWLGSSNSGVYRLCYDSISDEYISDQFLSRGQFAISNNDIRFVIADRDSNLYIGAGNGLNILKKEDNRNRNFYFQHYFADFKFTSAISVNNEVWFSTERNGVVVYNLDTRSFFIFNENNSPLTCNHIDLLKLSSQGNVLIGSSDLFIYQSLKKRWLTVSIDGNRINKIFEDFKGLLWVTTGKFGVQQVNQANGENKHFDLTPEKYKYLSDKERPYFYEDRNQNLWICVHGAGLAQYLREKDEFIFYRNDPLDHKSISSNTVMCMTEDHNGTLWIGTGGQGGVNKIIFKNPAFTSVPFAEDYNDLMENIVRSVFEDVNGNIWVGSKGGKLKIFNKTYNELPIGLNYPFKPNGGVVFNIYSIFQDSRGYIWLGSKGLGIAVSTRPFNHHFNDYSKIRFHCYQNISGDSSSLCDNNIYCIDEDKEGRIWFGTYGGGISFTKPEDVSKLSFVNIDVSNSNLSNNKVRCIKWDSVDNLWIATTFGLNKLSLEDIDRGNYQFDNYYHDPSNRSSLSYNDVVHIFEDSRHNMWFGTFGGGVDLLISDNTFKTYTNIDGLCNNDVFGIIEDNDGNIWLSTENGLSFHNLANGNFDNFNKSNSLGTNNFSENTCLKTRNGKLIFGSVNGFEVVEPDKVAPWKFKSNVMLTNFQLFNKEITLTTEGTPLKKLITYTDQLTLKHNQSSFSFEFSAMNFLDKSKNQYAYFLENFDDEWNYIGVERKATYTNLKPGDYIFRVKAASWNGKWDEQATVLFITILPPWWQTNYAYIVYLIVFVFATFIVSRNVIKISSIRSQLKIEKAINEVKLQFFTNISHEIRTPLTLILGPIEDVLSDRKFPSEFRSTLELMQKNGNRMLHLLNQLLDFRKVQNKKMVLKVSPIDIVDFTQGIFDNFVPQAQHKKINFKIDILAKPENVWVDPHRIDSVIFNILANAFKFTPSGKSVLLTIEQNLKHKEVYIKITDSGPGVRDKDIPLVFNRYTILSDDKSGNTGTGIGLNLSNEIIKMHGGEIRVVNHADKGCEFCIVLKTGTSHFTDNPNIILIDKNDEEYIGQNQLVSSVSLTENDFNYEGELDPKSEKPILLVVEDNMQILKYITEALSVRFSVLTAKNGKEGLEFATQYNPDLIISDVMMPVIDGIQMTKALKADFNTCHIPVVMLTAKSGVDDQILGIESGAEAYVLKPFNMIILKSMISNMLEQRKLVLKKYRDKADVEVSDIKINSRNQEFLDNVIKYIEENYEDPELSISTVAEHACVSRTVFYNKIKGLTGLSPIELMRQIKLKIAAQMLANGYNVNETAFKIGFNDSRYFSKQFKGFFGESPSQYKKKYQVEDDISMN